VKELLGVLIDDFGGTEFVSELKKDAIPADIKDEKHVVQIKVTDANLEKFVDILTKTTLPKAFDILSKEEYVKALNYKVENINKAREDLKSADLSKKKFDELRKSFVLGEATYTLGVDKSNYINHQDLALSGTVKADGDVTFKAKLNSNKTDIDKEQTFTTPVPSADQVIKWDEFQSMMDGSKQ
jgi:hypothetical protein